MLPQGDVASSVVCISMQRTQVLVDNALTAWLDIDCMLVGFYFLYEVILGYGI